MYKYFETEIKIVKINSVERECNVVNSITHSKKEIPNLTPIPKGYDESIMGMAYLPNESPIFQAIDVEETEEHEVELATKEDLENTKLDILACLVEMSELMI